MRRLYFTRFAFAIVWALISGGISVLAGASFIAAAGSDNPTLANIAGYAILGGIFFLVSALRLGRAAKKN